MNMIQTIGTSLFVLVAGTVGPTLALAATWTVEKDGSGDFSVVQDAIDAAAPGDTVLIGPGRYADFRAQNSTVDNFAFAGICWAAKADLTIIGAGKDVTFLGPATPIAEALGLPAGSLYLDGGAAGSTIEGVQLDNTRGIVTIRDQSIVQDCRVVYVPLTDGSAVSVLAAQDVIIRRTAFLGPDSIWTGHATSGLLVEDCTFHNETDLGTAVGIGNGAQNCTVRRCTFTRGGTGVQFGLGGTGVVEDCSIKGMKTGGINLSQGSAVVRRCYIGQARSCLRVGSGSLEVYDTVLAGGTVYTIATTGNLVVRGSHILNASEFTVHGRSVTPRVVDLRYNWWGTDDTAQIQSWIDDAYGTVLWDPIASEPIPNEERSMSELKGRYRP